MPHYNSDQKEIYKVVQNLQTKCMRQPTHAEIAADMGMSEHELRMEQAFQANAHESLADVYDQYSIWYASDDDNPEEKLGNEELKELLKTALHTLSERETLVIQLYYIEELNVFEIAEVMEISTGRVSQIKKLAIANLRSFITNAQHVG